MKKTLLALLLAGTLVLTGCNLVVKDPQVDARQVILSINGITVDKQTVTNLYNAQLNQEYQMQQMYQMYGMQAPPIDFDQLLVNAKDTAIRRELMSQQAKAQGLDALTEEEQATLDEQVETEWASTLEWVKANYLANTTLEGEALEEELEHRTADLGITREATRAALLEQLIADKLEEATTQDVTVSEEELQEDYAQRVEQDRAGYEENPDTYGTTVNGGGITYYAPPGYRFVKQVLIKFLEEDQKKIDEHNTLKTEADNALAEAKAALTANEEALKAEDLEEDARMALEDEQGSLKEALTAAQLKADQMNLLWEAAKAEGYQNILPQAQEVVARAQTEDFDTLVAELNQDPGMPASGYAIREGFASFDSAFVEPAMALEKVGDVSEPSPGIYGYYIVQYAADIPEGAVAFDGVRQELEDKLLTQKKDQTWEDALAAWREEADIQEYMNRMAD